MRSIRIATLLMRFILAVPCVATEYWVAKSGENSAPGTKAKPFPLFSMSSIRRCRAIRSGCGQDATLCVFISGRIDASAVKALLRNEYKLRLTDRTN